MIVYRESERVLPTAEALREVLRPLGSLADAAPADHATATDVLIGYGAVEAALADAAAPEADGFSPATLAARETALAVARLFRASAGGAGSFAPLARTACSAVEALTRLPLPETLGLRVPEGFAYYALYPEAYLEAAAAFACGARPGRCIVIGLRSIGATLSAVVAAELEAAGFPVESLTLRPRGAPFERRPVPEPDLAEWLECRRDAWFLIVDEGPGLSGSSFTGTADLLTALGVPESRIALFPSWLPDGETFVSERAREIWPRLRKFHVPFEALRRNHALMAGARDLSGGLWRTLLYPDEARWPAAQPQHERRKYLRQGDSVLLKFAGLGRHGAEKHALAERLAAAGFAPPALGLEHGFLTTAFVPGRPLGRRDVDGDLVATAARYIAFRRAASPIEEDLRVDELLVLVENNVRRGLGPDWLGPLGRLGDAAALFRDVPAVAVDARMLPHEWIRTGSGFLKTDGVDHFDDHFFPGPQDIAWDVAGFAVEFGLDAGAAEGLTAAVGTALRDPWLPARLPFLTLAYPATRLGYASLAASSLGASADGRRQAKLARRYAWQLRRAILAWEARASEHLRTGRRTNPDPSRDGRATAPS